jgi:hypothetical protein
MESLGDVKDDFVINLAFLDFQLGLENGGKEILGSEASQR